MISQSALVLKGAIRPRQQARHLHRVAVNSMLQLIMNPLYSSNAFLMLWFFLFRFILLTCSAVTLHSSLDLSKVRDPQKAPQATATATPTPQGVTPAPVQLPPSRPLQPSPSKYMEPNSPRKAITRKETIRVVCFNAALWICSRWTDD